MKVEDESSLDFIVILELRPLLLKDQLRISLRLDSRLQCSSVCIIIEPSNAASELPRVPIFESLTRLHWIPKQRSIEHGTHSVYITGETRYLKNYLILPRQWFL